MDTRLNELDYGSWAGLTSEQVRERFGADALEGWSRRGRRPEGAGWTPSAEETAEQTAAFARELVQRHAPSEDIVAVSSGGTLRSFLALVPDEWSRRLERGEVKVGTGRHGELFLAGDQVGLLAWNVEPTPSAIR